MDLRAKMEWVWGEKANMALSILMWSLLEYTGKSRARRTIRSLNSWKEEPRKGPVKRTEREGGLGEEQS